MPEHVKKYYTYHDEFPEQTVSHFFCEYTIKQILTTYTKEKIFRAMSYYAQSIGLGNDFEEIQIYQRRIFNIPPTRNPIILHRQAVCVIFQFLFSISDEEYGEQTDVLTKDIFLLLILANQLTDLTESDTLSIIKSLRKKNFFTNIKSIHYTNNKDDLQAGFYLFKKYYEKIAGLNKDDYNLVIKEKYGFDIEEYVNIIDMIEQRNFPNIFSLFEMFAVVRFEETHQTWLERNPQFKIPRDFAFLQKYPLVKIRDEYLVTDLHSVFTSIFKNIYRTLLRYDNISFKGEFGKRVVEPTIVELLTDIFTDDNVKILKVGNRKFEYADFGLLFQDSIFLFEIKSSLLNDASIYTDKYEVFMKIFNDKFVVKEGIHQQVRKIQLIEDNFEHFCSLSNLPTTVSYKIYPILVSFDESLMCFLCNWYLSMRFEVFKRISKLNLTKIELAKCHSTITFNEIYRMRYVDRAPSARLELLKKYSDEKDKHPISFSFYLQELNVFTIME